MLVFGEPELGEVEKKNLLVSLDQKVYEEWSDLVLTKKTFPDIPKFLGKRYRGKNRCWRRNNSLCLAPKVDMKPSRSMQLNCRNLYCVVYPDASEDQIIPYFTRRLLDAQVKREILKSMFSNL
ncbi:hypothetical protein RF11_08384 [Thelohanellus kitauei]|uniref:Uncharacterized protein n=1 Tax=Thelohanellus kitauei TaxID=669202 RepID=A0A0C2MTN4_THEKT|nr:hypothetical protein RF11_08384 [Thelohanellus kitauei]